MKDSFEPDSFEADSFQPDSTEIAPVKQSLVKKGWEALEIPEKMSRRGLGMISSMVPNPEPTGNLPLDILKGTPKVASDTLAQVAPGFVSRSSILSSGLLKGAKTAAPLFKSFARGLGSQLESASGSVPGSLEAEFKAPSLIFSRGKEAAKPLYSAAKEELTRGANIFEGKWKPDDIVQTAQDYISKGGRLEPLEAHAARKAVDVLLRSKQYVKDSLLELRAIFDDMAKASPNISKADPLYKRGLMASSLRNILPQNKYGGASAFKMGIAPALTGLGGFVGGPAGAAVGAGVAGATLSPIVQGATAGIAGLASKAISPLVNNPSIGSVIGAAVTPKVLTEEKAREYLNKAGGDKYKARHLAKEEGWSF